MVDQASFSFLSQIVDSDSAGSLDIRAYTTKIKEELARLEGQCLNDYLVVSQDVEVLYSEIDASLAVLDKIEGVVDKFEGRIAEVSDQVSNIQS